MERVIVAVKRSGDAHPRDLELPAEIPISDLAILVADALRWDHLPSGETYSIRVSPQGKILSPQQTLLSAVIRTGSTLEFSTGTQMRPSEKAPAFRQSTSAPNSGGVVSGWIPLADNLPTNQPSTSDNQNTSGKAQTPPDQKGFTWKKIS